MATFDKLIQEIGSRYCLGPMAYPLVQETLGLISGKPGGIGGFVNRFKAAGFAVEVASWLGGPEPVPLSGQEVEQTLGSDVISGIADKVGVSQRFARTILGYAIPKIIVLLAQRGAVPSAMRASASRFLDSAIPLSSSPVEEITQHGAEQIRPSRTELRWRRSRARRVDYSGRLSADYARIAPRIFHWGRRSWGDPVRADCGAKYAGGVSACAVDPNALAA